MRGSSTTLVILLKWYYYLSPILLSQNLEQAIVYIVFFILTLAFMSYIYQMMMNLLLISFILNCVEIKEKGWPFTHTDTKLGKHFPSPIFESHATNSNSSVRYLWKY